MRLSTPQPEQGENLAEKVELLETILDDSNQLVQMSYLEDMTMVYVNGTAKAFRGNTDDDHHGRHCYEYMMGLDHQCPFCPLLTQGDQESASCEVDNGQQVFSVKTMRGEWKGRPAFIEYAADITPARRARQGFENQVETLLNSIPEAQGVLHFDLTANRCLSVNGAATHNLEHVQSDVAVDTTFAQTFSFVPDEEERQAALEQFNREALIAAYESGTIELSREVESYFDDGAVRWARVTARLIQNPSNNHLECIFFGMDISEEMARREKLERDANRQLALFNALARDYLNVYLIDVEADTVQVLKLDGYITRGLENNKKTVYPYHEICKNYIERRVHPEDREMMHEAMSAENLKRQLATKSEYMGSYRVIDDGETHYYQFKYLIAENNIGILAGFQNIDVLIASEREQQELLRTALAAAEEANVAKSAFLSNMSHDIRTPLNAIIGFNELAIHHLDDKAAVQRYLEKVALSSEHLLELVNDVLDMSRIESGRVHVEEAPINLQSMLETLRTITVGNASTAGVRLMYDTSGIVHQNVMGDELKIKKILVNILNNAVKFTPAGGTVTFTAEEHRLRSSKFAHFVFRVRDTGVGMSREFQGHAFEPFAREHEAADGSVSGTGLGLSIVKSLVNIMDGSIRLESEPGVGTEFTVTLHLAYNKDAVAPVVTSEQKTAAASHGMEGKRVLLVEDNELNREIAYEILKEAGFVVDTAADGVQAVEAVAQSDPGAYDVVLMDIQMPNMNGYEAARAIRNLPNSVRAHVPIIAVTANAFSSDRDKALSAGMDGHIAKPIDVPLLIDKMRELIG